jgi:nitrogen fixation protein NifU and related proteins
MNIRSENADMPVAQDSLFGRMNDPSAGAWVTGPCGDTMEFYLVIEDDIIRQVKYYTDGCRFTRLCGRTVAAYIQGKSIVDALSVSGRHVLNTLPSLPPEHRHCAILAVSAFYRAAGQYWVDVANS